MRPPLAQRIIIIMANNIILCCFFFFCAIIVPSSWSIVRRCIYSLPSILKFDWIVRCWCGSFNFSIRIVVCDSSGMQYPIIHLHVIQRCNRTTLSNAISNTLPLMQLISLLASGESSGSASVEAAGHSQDVSSANLKRVQLESCIIYWRWRERKKNIERLVQKTPIHTPLRKVFNEKSN